MTVPKNASRIKKFVNSVGKVTAAEAAAVGTAQVAGDPNFASFLNEFLNIDQKLAEWYKRFCSISYNTRNI